MIGGTVRVSKARRGDIVKCNRGGLIFYALVVERFREGNRNTQLVIEPLQPTKVSYRHVSAREVIGYWRQSNG